MAAYTTVMCMMGNPAYQYAKSLSVVQFKDLSDEELLYSYTIIKCSFTFPDNVKYPSIACQADDTTTVYPLKGYNVLITGSEYLVARNQGCRFFIEEVYTIPFEKTKIIKTLKS